MGNYNVEKLLLITKEIMKEMNLEVDSLQKISLSRNDKKNFWNLLALKYFGYFDYNTVLKVKKWFERHNLYVFLKRDNLITQKNLNLNIEYEKVKIVLTIQEWMENYNLYLSKNNSDRSYFKIGFCKILTSKIQSIGLNCSLKCEYNYFKKAFSRKGSSKYWSGRYFCDDCKKIYNLEIENIVDFSFREVMISVAHDSSINKHKSKIEVKFQCRGSERSNEALNIHAKGIENRKAENILSNYEENFKGKYKICIIY